jgi:enoyl-CoA hydratase/carnithine racemase
MSRVDVRALKEDERIQIVTISGKETRNSLDKNSLKLLASAFILANEEEENEKNTKARCIIVTGDGDEAFSSGINLHAAKDVFQMSEFDYDADVVHAMEKCEIPIVCVVNGIAINAGFEIALAADIVLVTKNAVFMDLGLLPSWGLSTKLPRAVGASNAKLASVFGEALSGEDAVRFGLAQVKVFESKSEAMTEAIRLAKQMMEKSRSTERARVALDIIDKGWEKSYGEARKIEREKAFAQYKTLPLDEMFKTPRISGRGKMRSKL